MNLNLFYIFFLKSFMRDFDCFFLGALRERKISIFGLMKEQFLPFSFLNKGIKVSLQVDDFLLLKSIRENKKGINNKTEDQVKKVDDVKYIASPWTGSVPHVAEPLQPFFGPRAGQSTPDISRKGNI